MKSLRKRIICWLLIIAILNVCLPLTISAEPGSFDIYDAASLSAALKVGGEITIWQDINCTYFTVSEDLVLDLNGYKLTVTNGLKIHEGKCLTIRDNCCSEENHGNGELIVSWAISALNAELIIESGTINATGPVYDNYLDNYYDYNAYMRSGIIGGEITILGGNITAQGGNGYATFTNNHRHAYCGGAGISCASLFLFGGTVIAIGGSGDYYTGYQSGAYCSAGPGIDCRHGSMLLDGAIVTAQGGQESSNGLGGAGIAASGTSVAIRSGQLTAIGTSKSAGIGGNVLTTIRDDTTWGDYQFYNAYGNVGGDIQITGGTVSVKGGEGSFDIGGAGEFYYPAGLGGSLTVTGGSLEFCTYGRATNVTNPVFKDCTVFGDGAYQHEGTYNEDGKFTVEVTDIASDNTTAHAGETITLSADITVSRTSNISVPAPKGQIVFQSNGETIGQAPIVNPVTGDGYLTAQAILNWPADGGIQSITAAYVPGENDRYAPASEEVSPVECVIEPHIYQGVVSVDPTSSSEGELYCTCSICGETTSLSLPVLDDENYSYAQIKSASCAETGSGRYTWNETAYGAFSFDVLLPVQSHEYTQEIVLPTCTTKGYTKYTCINCGSVYQDQFTDSLGHSYNYEVTQVPTKTTQGVLTGTCSRCEEQITIALPKLDRTEYTYTSIKTATCTVEGTERYTWKNTNYGRYYFDLSIDTISHAYLESKTPPTCTEQGYTTYTCTVCGTRYIDNYVDALGHSYKAVVTAPTCIAEGFTTYTCSRCGDDYVADVVKALGHTPGSAVVKNRINPTCTADGGYDTVTNCTVCGAELTRVYTTLAPLGHTPGSASEKNRVNPSCTEAGGYDMVTNCTVCGAELNREHTALAPLGHLWDDGAIKPAPTCTEDGVMTYTCQRCSNTKTEAIAAEGHTPGTAAKEDEVAVSCSVVGGYNTVIRCTICNAILYSVHTEIAAIGHDYQTSIVNPTCTEIGYTTYTCSRCGDSYVSDEVAALGHEPETDAAIEPTCTEPGKTEGAHCVRCGEVLTAQEAVPALGHTWDDGVVTVEPTKEAAGEKTFTCTRCGQTRTEPVPKIVPPDDPKPGLPCDGGDSCPGRVFTDMPAKGNWAHDAIDWAVVNQITSGTSKTTFSPETGCTRGQVVTFLWRAAGSPEPTNKTNPFADVKEGTFYYKAVLWAVENGITNGTSKTTFSPDDTCTRGQIVTFLWRFEGSPNTMVQVNPFADVKSGAYFENAVLWAVSKEITNGTSKTTFSPDSTCTRAQVVTFLYRDIIEE